MKKLFLLAVGLAMTLTACQKDEGLVSDVATTSSFTVTIPQSGVQTRAVTDAFGTGTSVNRCILEIYHGDKLYDRIEKGVSGKTVTFDNLRLVSSQTYDFVFWADCAEGSEGNFTDKVYNTANLKSITEIGPFVGNSDERDAFFAKESFKVTGSFTKPVTLKRPFGLLVVKTNDLNEIKDEALKPTGYSVAFKGLPTTFNALTGEVSGSADVTYTAGELAKADGTISMDFLWATESEAALSDFTMTFLNNGTAICTNDAFTNIPIRRNYRTNVSGNLLTKKGSISVTIDPNFDANSPIDKVIAEVESVSAAASTAVVAAASDVHEHKSLIHVTGGDLLIDGVTLINDPEYHWHGSSYNTAAIAYWNDANVTIRNARVISGEFTLCGMGRNGANTATVTLIDSFFESTSSNLDNKQHWAYAMRLFGSEVLIENCEVKGIQGAVSIEENAKAEIRSGKFYTVNTSGQQDAFYALYVSSSAEVTITGGEFSAPNVRTGLQIEGTSAVVSGDNDTGRPSGSVILKGGKFSGKAYNHVTNTVYAPAAGYQWQAITDGDNLKWAVVPATR